MIADWKPFVITYFKDIVPIGIRKQLTLFAYMP